MSQLVPCPSCDRHVRLPEPSCPFCGGELNARALGAQYASRRGTVPIGIKRAALVAIGTVAAACGGKTEGTDEGTAPIVATESGTSDNSGPPDVGIPIYGASPASSDTDVVTTTTNVTTATTSTATPEPTLLPAYGTPIPPGTSEPAPESTAGEDTWAVAPAYGLPPPDLTSDVVIDTTLPSVDVDAGAGGDAGSEGDASADLSTVVDDFTDLAQPEYGAPIPEQ